MGVMDAIKKGFGIAAKNMGLVLVLIVFNAITGLASIPFAQATPEANPQLTAGALIFSLIFILLSILVQGGSLGVIRDYIKTGKSELGKMLPYGAKYYIRLLGLGLLIVLIIAIAGIAAALLVAATAPLNNTVVTVIAAIIAIAIGAVALYYVFLLIMAPYAIVCDEVGVVESMKKSARITRRSILKVLALLVLLVLISLGIGFVVGILTGIIAATMPVSIGQIVISIVSSIFNGYLGIVLIGAFMVFYLAISEQGKNAAEKVF